MSSRAARFEIFRQSLCNAIGAGSSPWIRGFLKLS
jgi:hypothetical protein